MAITPAESVEPAVIVTGFATEEFAAGVQMVIEGFVGFSGQGAANNVPLSRINAKKTKTPANSVREQRCIPFPQTEFGPCRHQCQGTLVGFSLRCGAEAQVFAPERE